MNKLEYDSLHKFYVSLGIILIAIPFVVMYFYINGNLVLISQVEFDELSAFSRDQLSHYECWVNIISLIIPVTSIISLVAGVWLLRVGVKSWKKVQNDLDAVVEANRIKSELEINKMKNSEVLARTVKEIQETDSANEAQNKSAIMKYMEIEDGVFTRVKKEVERAGYMLQRDVRVNHEEYDMIAVSLKDNIDLIYEIKYLRKTVAIQKMRQIIQNLYEAGVNYETEKHRNFRCILLIVTPVINIDVLRDRWNGMLGEKSNKDISFLQVKFLPEESLCKE